LKVAELEQLLSTEKQLATALEQVYNKSEQKNTKQLQEYQELDKQSAVYMSELKARIVQLEEEKVEMERQRSVLRAHVAAVSV
jgi:hypothetical protein